MNEFALKEELKALEGILYQDPETGRQTNLSYVSKYTNRVFGAPFQLLDSVDKRFNNVNQYVGSEYLRNFMLNSPILRIRPGMPKYTGGDNVDGIIGTLKNLYFSSTSNDLSAVQSLIMMMSKVTIFKQGSKLQRRMFGFRETYYDYMQHVNYMCRSCAVFLELTNTDRFPNGTFASNSNTMQSFDTFKWENYRMMAGSYAKGPYEHLKEMLLSTGDKAARAADSTIDRLLGADIFASNKITSADGLASWLASSLGGSDESDLINYNNIIDTIEFANDQIYDGPIGAIENKITAVEFMVEPTSFEENLSNTTSSSLIESTMDGLKDSVGSEIGWITNSHADTGAVGGIMDFLGSSVENATTWVAGAVEGVTGGFMTSLFSGALQSIKGQKMIYPEIYKSSNSTMDYQFSMTLTTPYGDPYNYYMNILVPLMHLVALVAPRMVTANTVASPYLVQAYLPGQCTCQLGIIDRMTITKNPNNNKVSVNGFPLEVKVTFTIKELYNALSISPANDPASFLFNETLNDYMANLAGLIPSVDTYTKQREAAFYALEDYIVGGGLKDDIAQALVEKYEDFVNPFIAR